MKSIKTAAGDQIMFCDYNVMTITAFDIKFDTKDQYASVSNIRFGAE